MTTEDVQTNIRLPANLKERLVKVAAQNKRSLSAEVAARLEQSLLSTSEQSSDLAAQVKKGLDAAIDEVRVEIDQLRSELQRTPWAKEFIEAARKKNSK